MFMNPDHYKTQIDAYSQLIAGTALLVNKEFGRQTRGRNFGSEIANEIITFETKLAKVPTYFVKLNF